MSIQKLLWDEKNWLREFKAASTFFDSVKLHSLRELVFRHTQACCCNGGYETALGKVTLQPPLESTVYSERILLDQQKKRGGHKINIEILNEDCLKTAFDHKEMFPLVLNMASSSCPGGGVERGSAAQEECLFRSSNYYQTMYPLKKKFYPLNKNYGAVYSPSVTIFRGLEEEGYPLLEKPFDVSMLAVAAVNRPQLDSYGDYTKAEKNQTVNKIKTILNVAMEKHHMNLVLSAFGCGAFKNPPEKMAVLFKEILSSEPYASYFENIYFSIKWDSVNKNFKAFSKVFLEEGDQQNQSDKIKF